MFSFKSYSIFVLAIISISVSALAVPKPPTGYQIETVATYDSTGLGEAKDLIVTPDGSMYLTHRGTSDVDYWNGSITRVVSGNPEVRWIDNLGAPRDLAWVEGQPYGDNIYFANLLAKTIQKINPDGTYSSFAQDSSRWPNTIEFDRNGAYGGSMFCSTKGAGTGGVIYRVSETGSKEIFSWFPNVYSGGILDLKISPTSRYNGSMFAALDEDHGKILPSDGIYKIETNGTASRFAPSINYALGLEFDTSGLMFDNDLFVVATSFDPDVEGMHLWRIDENGNAEDFMRVGWGATDHIAFGPDGAMYLTEYNGDTTSILRVSEVPEPASLILLGLGGFFIRRKLKA